MEICAVSKSRISPTMMMSGSWRKKERSALPKVMPDRLVDRHLHDAFDVKFHRVLGRQQLGVNGVDPAQTGIKRGGLAATGRAGDHEDAVGPENDLGDEVIDVLGQAEGLDFQIDRRAVQHAQHDRFAERGGQGRHAQIHLAVVD